MTAWEAEGPMQKVMVVDDDISLRTQVAGYLADHGFMVHEASDAASTYRLLESTEIDLLVLDVMLPGEDGLSICRRVTAKPGPAVVFLSAMGEDIDRVIGLELGADDYLGKPCNPRELLARVRAVLRRREEAPPDETAARFAYTFEGFHLDFSRRQLKAPNGVVVVLTAGEFSLLSAFLAHPRRVLSRDQLIEYARGSDADVFDRVVDVQISRLRRKLHACIDRELIVTYRGVGYLFEAVVAQC